jgi:hypothetical protein
VTAAARHAAATALVTLAVVAGVIGNLSGWAWWFLFDTGNFVRTVAPLSSDPAVSEALATELVDQILRSTDARARLERALPEDERGQAGPIADRARAVAIDGVQRAIGDETFNRIWREALESAHRIALGILRGDDAVVTATDGRVVLDLSAVAVILDDRLTAEGFDLFDPQDLPPSFGRFAIVEDAQLHAAQRAVDVLDTVQLWAPLVTLGLLGGALAVASRRRWTIGVIGAAFAVAMALQLLALRFVRRFVLGDVTDDRNRRAAETVWDGLTERLRLQSTVLLVVGLLVLAAALGLAAYDRRALRPPARRLDRYR